MAGVYGTATQTANAYLNTHVLPAQPAVTLNSAVTATLNLAAHQQAEAAAGRPGAVPAEQQRIATAGVLFVGMAAVWRFLLILALHVGLAALVAVVLKAFNMSWWDSMDWGFSAVFFGTYIDNYAPLIDKRSADTGAVQGGLLITAALFLAPSVKEQGFVTDVPAIAAARASLHAVPDCIEDLPAGQRAAAAAAFKPCMKLMRCAVLGADLDGGAARKKQTEMALWKAATECAELGPWESHGVYTLLTLLVFCMIAGGLCLRQAAGDIGPPPWVRIISLALRVAWLPHFLLVRFWKEAAEKAAANPLLVLRKAYGGWMVVLYWALLWIPATVFLGVASRRYGNSPAFGGQA